MNRFMYPTLLIALAMFAGCGTEQAATEPDPGQDQAAGSVVADSEPEGAIAVGQARESIEDGQPVTLVGTIGGSREPFVDGLAAFTVVDTKIPSCADEEGCPTPWDYCCTQDQVKDNIATVKVVDDAGQPLSGDAKQMLGVQELSTVVVSGVAERDDQGNLTVAADRVFIRSDG